MMNIDVEPGKIERLSQYLYRSVIRLWLAVWRFSKSILTDKFILTAFHCVAEILSEIDHLQAIFGISTTQEAFYLESYDHEIHYSSIRNDSTIWSTGWFISLLTTFLCKIIVKVVSIDLNEHVYIIRIKWSHRMVHITWSIWFTYSSILL